MDEAIGSLQGPLRLAEEVADWTEETSRQVGGGKAVATEEAEVKKVGARTSRYLLSQTAVRAADHCFITVCTLLDTLSIK